MIYNDLLDEIERLNPPPVEKPLPDSVGYWIEANNPSWTIYFYEFIVVGCPTRFMWRDGDSNWVAAEPGRWLPVTLPKFADPPKPVEMWVHRRISRPEYDVTPIQNSNE